MTKNKQQPVWITIPDEAPAASVQSDVRESSSPDKNRVTNKAFWGGGFIALIAFMGLLFTPQFTEDHKPDNSIQANLFDGGFQLVPDFEQQQEEGVFFGGEEGKDAKDGVPTSGGTKEGLREETVIKAQSEAVSIQVKPIIEASEGSSAEKGSLLPEGDEAQPATDANQEPADANAQLLQTLSQQLQEFKEKEEKNEQRIQDLMQLLEDQATGLRPAATQVSDSLLPATQQPQPGQADVSKAQLPIRVGPGGYRYNTHTVTVSPHDVLAQNQGIQAQQFSQQSFQASVVNVAQSYNPSLSAVQGQPTTGPGLLLVLLLMSFGVLVWGSVRADNTPPFI